MGDADFAGWLEELLTSTPVPPARLIVEITETAAIVNLERARALADTLRRLGCLLALDDFGAGFASFSYLKHLRFDVLKIDGEFVRGLRENPTDRLVVEAVVRDRPRARDAVAGRVRRPTPTRSRPCGRWASTTRRASTSAGRCRSTRRWR